MQAPEVSELEPLEAYPGDAEQGGLFAEINITPLTDVVLVLLIIFMVSSSAMVDAVRSGHLDVSLPPAGHADGGQEGSATLVVGIARDGRAFIGEKVVDREHLEALLARTHQEAPQTAIIVDADGGLEHRHVVELIDRVRAAGFTQVGIGAQAP